MQLKWGIFGGGSISHDFVTTMNANLQREKHLITGVAGRDATKIKIFAELHNIPKYYSSYEELAKDDNINIGYIGVINTKHFDLMKLLLNNGKHVLCEKPLAMSESEVKEVTQLAKKKNLFLMEAVWSRFFPIYKTLRNLLKEGEIGDVLHLQSMFCVKIAQKERVLSKNLGGGVTLDIGIYCLQLASFVFGNEIESISINGILNENQVDEAAGWVIKFKGGQLASSICDGRFKGNNSALICGTKGSIEIFDPFWCPTKMKVNDKMYEFPLPCNSENYNHTNSAGLMYEAEEVYNCIKNSQLESKVMTHQDSVVLAKLEDEIRGSIK